MGKAGRDPAIGGAGIAAALFAFGDIAFWAIRMASALPPPSVRMLLVALAVSVVSIFLLSRFNLPNALRAALISGILLMLLVLAAKSDLFGIKATEDKILDATARTGPTLAEEANDKSEGVPVDMVKSSGSGRPRGAVVHLSPGDAGDGGWADTINTASDGLIGGAAAEVFSIDGTVTLIQGNAGGRLAVRWSIAQGSDVARCGTTTILNASTAPVVDQVVLTFRTAVKRSVGTERAACF